MAKVCKNLQELRNEIMKRVNIALDTDVADTVKDVMTDHIQKDVYDKYKPVAYKRRGVHGGLADPENLNATLGGDGELFVQNITLGTGLYYNRFAEQYMESVNKNEFITPIIESGMGYDTWDEAFPRPYVQNTHDDLEQNHYHTEALKQGLKKQGLEVK